MINEIIRALFKVIFFVLRWFFNILLLPLKPIISLFPDFSDFLEIAINFFDNYVFKAVGFGRQVVINLTGFPQAIITISVTFAFALIGVITTLKMITFVKNIWSTFKGGKTN